MPPPMITLTADEIRIAAMVGILRQCAHLGRRRDRFPTVDPWEQDIHGACGELAVCKFTGLVWTGLAQLGARDVGDGIEVRTRRPSPTVRDDELLLTIWPDSLVASAAYVLVISRLPVFEICGWIYGHEAQRADWLLPLGRSSERAYRVPRLRLHAPEDLVGLTREIA